MGSNRTEGRKYVSLTHAESRNAFKHLFCYLSISSAHTEAQSPTKVKSRGLNHDDGDDDDDDGYRSSKGNSKKQPKIKAMPEWTRTGFVAKCVMQSWKSIV